MGFHPGQVPLAGQGSCTACCWWGAAPGMMLQTLPGKESIVPDGSELLPSAHFHFSLMVTSDTFRSISCSVKKKVNSNKILLIISVRQRHGAAAASLGFVLGKHFQSGIVKNAADPNSGKK